MRVSHIRLLSPLLLLVACTGAQQATSPEVAPAPIASTPAEATPEGVAFVEWSMTNEQNIVEYRILRLCSGELSFAAAKCYDIEIWAPGIERWLEVSSCSNFIDFQARRTNIRFRDEDGKVKFVHTLNGSGVALARLILVLIETYQNEDGTIDIPEVVQPYMRGKKVIGK